MENGKLEETLAGIGDSLQEISLLLRFAVKESLDKELLKLFKNHREAMVYELSNGKRSTRDIEKVTGVSRETVSKLWQKWHQDGVVESTGAQKPCMAKFSLVEIALLAEGRQK